MNEEAALIYLQTRDQVLTVGDRVVSVNHLAVEASMQRNDVRDRRGCFEKVLAAFRDMLAQQKRVME